MRIQSERRRNIALAYDIEKASAEFHSRHFHSATTAATAERIDLADRKKLTVK